MGDPPGGLGRLRTGVRARRRIFYQKRQSPAGGKSGGALAGQARWLAEQGIAGTALYRYDSLFENAAWPELAAQECAALRAAAGA